jgi:hypothetical protein
MSASFDVAARQNTMIMIAATHTMIIEFEIQEKAVPSNGGLG